MRADQTPLLVYGTSTMVEETVALARQVGFAPRYLIDPRYSDVPPTGLPMVAVEDARLLPPCPIVVLDTPERGLEYRFSRLLARVRDKAGKRPLLHPAALALRVPPPSTMRRRWAVFGYPGSGNILAQEILRHLAPDDQPVDALRRHLADTQALSLRTAVEDAFGLLSGFTYQIGPGLTPLTAGMQARCDEGWFWLLGLPYAGGLEHNLGMHVLFDRAAEAEMAALGHTNFHIVRHPLLVLRSALRKLSATADATPGTPVFHNLIEGYLASMEAALRPDAPVHLIRFERLLTEPLVAIEELAAVLGVPCDTARAAVIRDATLHRELVGEQARHFQGAATAPDQAFDDVALDVLARAGVAEIAVKLGYTWPRRAASAPPAAATPGDIIYGQLSLLPGHVARQAALPELELQAETAALRDQLTTRLAASALPHMVRSLGSPTDSLRH